MDLGENVFVLKNIRFEYFEDEVTTFEIVEKSWLEVSNYLKCKDSLYEDFFCSCHNYLTKKIKVLYIIGDLSLLNSNKLIVNEKELKYY